MSERERERETDRQTHRDTERHTDRDTQRERTRTRERERGREREGGERERERERLADLTDKSSVYYSVQRSLFISNRRLVPAPCRHQLARRQHYAEARTIRAREENPGTHLDLRRWPGMQHPSIWKSTFFLRRSVQDNTKNFGVWRLARSSCSQLTDVNMTT